MLEEMVEWGWRVRDLTLSVDIKPPAVVTSSRRKRNSRRDTDSCRASAAEHGLRELFWD
jgi:hypothetical protein